MKKNSQDHFLSTILDSIADGVFAVDTDWRITSFNKAAQRITGVPPEEAIGKHCYDVFQANICQTACALKRTMDSGQQVIDLPIDVLNSQGQRVPISISTAVLRDQKNKVVGGVESRGRRGGRGAGGKGFMMGAEKY